MLCHNCSDAIEQDRLDIVPETKVCSLCARNINLGKRKKGYMSIYGKTGSEIQILTYECFESQKKYIIPNGARSCVKNFSKSSCN